MIRLSTIKYWLRLSIKLKNKPLIVSAGMPRSGSTLLYNILREILSERWPECLSSGWESDIFQLPEGKAYLVKTHHIDGYYRFRAKHAFYTFRDIRVAAISSMRKFNKLPTIKEFRKQIGEYAIAKKLCDNIIKYEDLLSQPRDIIQQISQTLGVAVSADQIVEKTFNLQPDENISEAYSEKTLLHKGHFTNTKNDEWRSLLPETLKKEVNTEFSWWFKECGYPEN